MILHSTCRMQYSTKAENNQVVERLFKKLSQPTELLSGWDSTTNWYTKVPNCNEKLPWTAKVSSGCDRQDLWIRKNKRDMNPKHPKQIYYITYPGARKIPPDHLLLDSAPNLGLLISRWDIEKFENCWYKSVRILEVLKLLCKQFLHLSSFQRDMSGPILGALSNNMWSGGKFKNVFQQYSICHILM
jgi:hypothetical protein